MNLKSMGTVLNIVADERLLRCWELSRVGGSVSRDDGDEVRVNKFAGLLAAYERWSLDLIYADFVHMFVVLRCVKSHG